MIHCFFLVFTTSVFSSKSKMEREREKRKRKVKVTRESM